MASVLPTLPAEETDYRSEIENHVLEIAKGIGGTSILVKKYFKTANEQIFEDSLNIINSGVPAYLIRTRREETDDASPVERMDYKTARLEVLCVSNVGIEKEIRNVDRYVYTMSSLMRIELRKRANRIKLPNNRKRPFVYLGNRDIFRNNDVDILLSEFNVEYIAL